MTEGIIQNVGYRCKSMLDRNAQFTYNDVILHFEHYEKKLIEEIRKEFNKQNKYPMGITLKSLIGDTE